MYPELRCMLIESCQALTNIQPVSNAKVVPEQNLGDGPLATPYYLTMDLTIWEEKRIEHALYTMISLKNCRIVDNW